MQSGSCKCRLCVTTVIDSRVTIYATVIINTQTRPEAPLCVLCVCGGYNILDHALAGLPGGDQY